MAGQVFTRPTPRHAVRPDAQGNAVVSRIKCFFTKMKAVVSWRRGISGQFPVSNPRKRTPFGKSFVFSHLVKPSSKPYTGYGVGKLSGFPAVKHHGPLCGSFGLRPCGDNASVKNLGSNAVFERRNAPAKTGGGLCGVPTVGHLGNSLRANPAKPTYYLRRILQADISSG